MKIFVFLLFSIFTFAQSHANEPYLFKKKRYLVYLPNTNIPGLGEGLYKKINSTLLNQGVTIIDRPYDELEAILPRIYSKQALKAVVESSDANHIILPEINRITNTERIVTLSIVDIFGNITYRQQKKINSVKENEINILVDWIDEYFSNGYDAGRIVKINSSRVVVYFPPHFPKENIMGVKFKLHCFEEKCKEVNKLNIQGYFREIDGEFAVGFLDKSYPVLNSLASPENYNLHIIKNREVKDFYYKDRTNSGLDILDYYKNPLRNCAVLPITGNFKWVKNIEEDLRNQMIETQPCHYRKNTQIEKVLKKYKNNLYDYLRNPIVLSTLSKRLQAGTMTRVHLTKDETTKNINLKMQIVGENGYDIYFEKSYTIGSKDPKLFSNAIMNGLRTWHHNTPLDAVIKDIKGKDIFIDINENQLLSGAVNIEVYRPVKIKRENQYYVTWETKSIATGVLRKFVDGGARGEILNNDALQEEVKKGDWVRVLNYEKYIDFAPQYTKYRIQEDRRNFRFKLAGDVSKYSTAKESTTEPSIFLGLDVYFWKNFIFITELERRPTDFSTDPQENNLRLAAAYSIFIKNFKFVSLIDIVGGFLNRRLLLGDLGVTGLGDIDYDGLYLGGRIEIPLLRRTKFYAGMNWSPILNAVNQVSLIGDGKETSYWSVFANADYLINRNFSVFGEVFYENFETVFEVGDTKVNSTAIKSKIGLYYNF